MNTQFTLRARSLVCLAFPLCLQPLFLLADVKITGELKTWHTVTVELEGPQASETDVYPNPFTDYSMRVTFTHESGEPTYTVPGYFAADGNAAETSATSGNIWRAHLSPDKTGEWRYEIEFLEGRYIAVGREEGEAVEPFHGMSGGFEVGRTDKRGRGFRAHGRLEYVGEHYLKFAETGAYFLKAGVDSPETFLGYGEFDNTIRAGNRGPLKTWEPHVQDWKRGDPAWQKGKGKGIIGALNYLAEQGLNAVSFLTYNAGGDGDNVWPFVSRNNKLNYDVSKLEQWGIVFAHAQALGLYLHFKLQETEIDDDRTQIAEQIGSVPESLDGGKLGAERRLYLREIIARFGHHLALNWNLGEENTQSAEEIRAMAEYIQDMDPYDHNRVIHTYPNQQDKVYTPLLGEGSVLTGASLQNNWNAVHRRTLQWRRASAAAGRPWVVANDEQGDASTGVPPDPGYEGFSGIAEMGDRKYDLHDIRKQTLWGNLMAGGAGVEYYFGYRLPQNDLRVEDYRSRHQSWQYCRIAIEFFQGNDILFWRMQPAQGLIEYAGGAAYCFRAPDEIYLVYLSNGGEVEVDLREATGRFTLDWFNPRTGDLMEAENTTFQAGKSVQLTAPSGDGDDWLAILRK